MKAATARKKAKTDWSALDAMTEEERHAAAMADPDARPMTEEDMGGAHPACRVRSPCAAR